MGYQDIFLKSTDSTNRVAREMGDKGGAHGSGVVAESQTGGRGRLGREWFSPPAKNLYCSYVVRPRIEHEHYPKLTLAAGVAAASCIRTGYHYNVGLKWPNDLFVGARKIAGILSESSIDCNDEPFAVIGIGINCNLTRLEIPADLIDKATSLFIESGTIIDIRQLYFDLRKSLLSGLEEFEEEGFSAVLTRWHEYDIFLGRTMAWLRADGTRVEGENLGPDEDGSLLVRDESGVIHRVLSGDVNLTDIHS